MYWVVVVNGPACGTVWLLTGEGATPCVPSLDVVGWYSKALAARDDWQTALFDGR
jgi:hypothetical protein